MRFSELLKCDQCENLLTTKQLLEAHVRNKHKKDAEIVLFPDDTLECNTCAYVSDTKTELETHKKENHKKEKEFPCTDCDFQATSRAILRKHRQLLHNKVAEIESTPTEIGHISQIPISTSLEEVLKDVQIVRKEADTKMKKCPFCNEIFSSSTSLAQHRRESHLTYKPCRNIDQCTFGIDCFYSHIPISEGLFRCFQCGDEFNTINEMMLHRKENHEGVKICKKFLENQCMKDNECWWLHNNAVDFQKIPENLAPPGKAWPTLQKQNQYPNLSSQTTTINNTILKMMLSLQENIQMMKQIMEHQNKTPQ